MKKTKKIGLIVLSVMMVAAFAVALVGCGETAPNVKSYGVNVSGSMRAQEGLGNIITTNSGKLQIYDNNTYELSQQSVMFADWGNVIVYSTNVTYYGVYTETSSDEFGSSGTLAVPDRIVFTLSGMTAGWSKGYTDTSVVKDSTTLAAADLELFKGDLKKTGNAFEEAKTVEITAETGTYAFV